MPELQTKVRKILDTTKGTNKKSYLTFANQVALSLWNNENCCQIVATEGIKP